MNELNGNQFSSETHPIVFHSEDPSETVTMSPVCCSISLFNYNINNTSPPFEYLVAIVVLMMSSVLRRVLR